MNQTRDRGQGQIRAHGSKLQLRYYVRGQRVEESTQFTDSLEGRKKAEKLLRKRLGEVEAGIARDSRALRYQDLREAYFADYRMNRRKSLRFDRQGNPYLDKVNRLDEFFMGARAVEIDADLIRKFAANEQGRGLSNGSINRSVSALRRMFRIAKQDGRLRTLPYFPMLAESAPRQGFFEREQYEALSRALPVYLRLPLAMGFYTAMREGEILSLRWSQVDFLAGLIRLRAGETKNDEAREVPIVPQLRSLLTEQYGARKCDYVCFRMDRQGHAVKIKGFRKAWYSACVKCGLGAIEPVVDPVTGKPIYEKPRGPRSKPKMKTRYRGMIFHDLRRTGVRNLVRAGVPTGIARKISGHKTNAVFERYNIVSPADVQDAGRKLGVFHGQEFRDKTGTNSTETQQVVSSVN